MTEWYEIHSDKVKVKLWGEKMKKLAQKIKEPGGEEKVRTKIEKYLKHAPEQCPEVDNEISEFRKQLPNNIVKKLKKMYSNPKEPNVNVYRMEIPKYCSRLKIDNFRKAVLNWTKTLSVKKKDFLGRNVKKDDVFKYVAEKLEPLVLDRPPSDSEYKQALQSSITEIVYELPIAVSSHNKDFHLNKAIENLVENIFTIENKFSSTYIQPTTKEIEEFVKDEITFCLEKCRVAISTKRMEYLEKELVDRLLDLTDITDIDSSVADDVTKLLEVGKLPEYKAKYFTNLILNDYKEFFFRENFFQKGNSDRGRPEVYSDFQNDTGLVELDAATSLKMYRLRLVEEINKWLTKCNIPNTDKKCTDSVVKDLAGDIVDRCKYLSINPSATGTDAEELEQLKFQIYKWTNKFVGDENTTVLDHAQELMKEINNIPKPSFQDSSEVQSLSPINTDININTSKPFIDKLTEQIYDWYCELPVNFHTSQDARHNKRIIKELAEEIEKGLENKEDEVTDQEVRKWTDKVFNKKLSYYDVQQLKNRISSVPYAKDNRGNDLKQEKVLIRSYEDIVEEWIDTVPIAPIKLRLFINNKNEIVHSIAVKIFKIKTKLRQLPAEVVEMKLQEELSHYMKKLPLHVKVDNQNDRNKYATKLVKIIQRQSKIDFLGKHPLVSDKPVDKQLEYVIIEWLRKLPLYREKTPEERRNEESALKGLAEKIIQKIGNEDADLNKEILHQIGTLDPKQNDDYVQNTAFKLKLYIQKLDLYKDLCKQREKENKLLTDTIEVWLKGLPLQITDANRFQNQKTDFIKSVKQLLSSGSDHAVMRKEILVFAKTLPMSHTKIHDLKYLNAEVLKLVRTLKGEPIGDVASMTPATGIETISDAIKVWTSTLPLKPVYCPRELHSFTDDMCSVITSILLNPDENSTKEQNDAKLYSEISKFLRRFPLIYELSTESHIFGMAAELSKSLKNINLFRNDKYLVNNVTVYDVSVNNKTGTDDLSIQSIKDRDINVNLETYSKQLVEQIGEWFDRLNFPEANQKGFKEVVINDLAADIVDRHKYLELNPNNSQSEEDELEHLKYQIFKWINKLVGEENSETIAHADDLMRRIKSIPVRPMLVRTQDKANGASGSSSLQQCCEKRLGAEGQQNRSSPSASPATSNRMDPTNPNTKPCCSQEPPPAASPSDEEAKEAMYQKFVTTFTDHCNALPLDDSTPDQKNARQAIFNGIILTFFKLKADPVIENDYGYFEFILEEKIDQLLDDLPQTEELKKIRHSWKTSVLESALRLLDEMHAVSDRPSFRQRVKDKFNRQLAVDNDIQQCFDLQQNFLNSVADAYILQVNYKEKDPVKANIYKNRLMAEIDKLVNHFTKEHNAGFRLFNQAKLRRITMKALEQVPVPTDDILKDEVEEIHLADEIEKWYKELPTKPLQNETDGVLIKRMIDILAKKLNEMHKRENDDQSVENKMKHEVSNFLEKRGQIQEGHVHKITDMVDVLHSRLKDRWSPVQDPGGFDEFAKEKPLSSTLANVDNAEFLAPLMNAATSTSPQVGQGTFGDAGYFIQPGQTMPSLGQVPLCSLMSSGVDPYMSRQVPCGMNQEEGYASRQGTPSLRSNLEGSPYGLRQGLPQPSPQRPNLSQQVQSPKQTRQSQLVQNAAYTSPKNGRGSCHTSQGREQSINQSLRQVGLTGPQEQQSRANQMRGPNIRQVSGSGSDQGQLFVPGNQRRSQGPSSCGALGNVSTRGPTPSQGVGTTAEAAIGGTGATRETKTTSPFLSSDEDDLDGEFRVKCRCLEAFRRMQKMDYDEQCGLFRSYRSPY